MPSRTPEAALRHMLDNILLAREVVVAGDPALFASDWRSYYAATRCLEIISEASRALDEATRTRHPGVPCRDIADAGNVYRHGYESVDPRRVWDTIVEALPRLEQAVRVELTQLDPGGF